MTRRSSQVLELENLRLRKENAELRAILLSAEKKLLIAGQQRFRCATSDKSRCPCWILNEGSFDESGFQVDHCPAWRECYRSDRAVLQALCHSCHALKTRLERISDLERGDADLEEGADE